MLSSTRRPWPMGKCTWRLSPINCWCMGFSVPPTQTLCRSCLYRYCCANLPKRMARRQCAQWSRWAVIARKTAARACRPNLAGQSAGRRSQAMGSGVAPTSLKLHSGQDQFEVYGLSGTAEQAAPGVRIAGFPVMAEQFSRTRFLDTSTLASMKIPAGFDRGMWPRSLGC